MGKEYLATEIYGYAYEQGVDHVYIKGLKERMKRRTKNDVTWFVPEVTVGDNC